MELKNSELRLKYHKEFEREYVVRKELALEEERFYKDTIETGLADNLFNPDEGLAGLPPREEPPLILAGNSPLSQSQ